MYHSCISPTSTCSGGARASCAPLLFCPEDPRWGGAFARTTFAGDADPIAWLSARSWMWEPFRAAVVGLADWVRRRWGTEARFVFEVEWSFDGPHPTVHLCVLVDAYPPTEIGGPEWKAHQEEQMEIHFVEEMELVLSPFERPLFDGHEVPHHHVWIRVDVEREEERVEPPPINARTFKAPAFIAEAAMQEAIAKSALLPSVEAMALKEIERIRDGRG